MLNLILLKNYRNLRQDVDSLIPLNLFAEVIAVWYNLTHWPILAHYDNGSVMRVIRS